MKWTEARLQRLFRYYNTRYWQGKLPEYRVLVKRLRWKYGDCNKRRRRIRISVAYRSDREVRATLLHEMCHAAHRWIAGKDHHGDPFYRQMMTRCPQWFVDDEYRKWFGMPQKTWMLKNWSVFASSRAEVAEMFAEGRSRKRRKTTKGGQ